MKCTTQPNEFCLDPFLVSLPAVNPERAKLHIRISASGDKLAARAHKYLSLATEYNERKRYARDQANPPANMYLNLFTRRVADVLKIPYLLDLTTNSTAEYVAAFDSLNGLVKDQVTAKRTTADKTLSAACERARRDSAAALAMVKKHRATVNPIYCESIGA